MLLIRDCTTFRSGHCLERQGAPASRVREEEARDVRAAVTAPPPAAESKDRSIAFPRKDWFQLILQFLNSRFQLDYFIVIHPRLIMSPILFRATSVGWGREGIQGTGSFSGPET